MRALSVAAEMAWKVAAAEAANARHPQIGNAILLVGLCSLEKLLAAKDERALSPETADAVRREADRVEAALSRAGLEPARLRRALRDRAGRGTFVHGDRPVGRSGPCKETFYRAALLAGGSEVTCLHLLAAVAQDPDPLVSKPLRDLGASLDALKEQALLVARAAPAPGPEKVEGRFQASAGKGETPHLDWYGRDLTAPTDPPEAPALVGRRVELQRVLQILSRAAKRNPVLVGEPGTGRTAIVRALAARAADGKEALVAGRRIVELVPAAFSEDAGDESTPEERLHLSLEDARAHAEVLLFVDDLPSILGNAPATAPGDDLRGAFKAALARPDLRFVAVATPESYRLHVEADPALERRFEAVDVGEPTRDESLEILRAFVPFWERRNAVSIDDDALAAAVDLSLRFDHDHRLPRKALDVVDEAAARARAPFSSAGEDAPTQGRPGATGRVTERGVAQVLAERIRLPLELLVEALPSSGRSRVLELENHLRARIVGQDEALARIGRRLRLVQAETRERRSPPVFLFLGPRGVGKTETARLVASHLYGGPEALALFDMSEYGEERSLVRLVGAPPGYVGHEEEGTLSARLRTRPYGVVLLDGIEKAHPRILDLFLRVFETGFLRDGRGRLADARHSVFVMTSDLGTKAPAPLEDIRQFFRPEVLERIDEQVVFRPLGPEDAARIVRPLLDRFVDALRREHGVLLTVEPAAEAFIAQAGLATDRGMGEVGRAVERLVEAPVAHLILEGKIKRHPSWTVAYDEGGVYVIPAPGA